MVNHNSNAILPSSSNRGQEIAKTTKPLYNIDMSDCVLMTVDEVKNVLRVSRSTVYRYLNNLSLPAIRLEGRTMVRASDLKKFVASREAYKGCLNEI